MVAHSFATADTRGASPASEAHLRLRPLSALPDASGETPGAEIDQIIADWVRSYLMRPHPKLGRPGAVCPFTSAAAPSRWAARRRAKSSLRICSVSMP